MLLTTTKDLLTGGHISAEASILSISWWLSRVVLLQQRIMDERSSSLFDLFHVYIGESLRHFGTIEKVSSYWGSQLDKGEELAILSMVYLEAGIGEHIYGRLDSCRLVDYINLNCILQKYSCIIVALMEQSPCSIIFHWFMLHGVSSAT